MRLPATQYPNQMFKLVNSVGQTSDLSNEK